MKKKGSKRQHIFPLFRDLFLVKKKRGKKKRRFQTSKTNAHFKNSLKGKNCLTNDFPRPFKIKIVPIYNFIVTVA